MNHPRQLTPEVVESGGVYVATFRELPGVVCEGDTEREAREELYAGLRELAERLEWQEPVSIRTENVGWWSFTTDAHGGASAISIDGGTVSFASHQVEDDGQRAVSA